MKKENSHSWAWLKFLCVLPLAAISTVAFAQSEAANSSNGVSEPQVTEQKTTEDDEEVYQVVELMPEFPGGMAEMMKFIQRNIRYPKEARVAGVQGRAIVQFIVDKAGVITNPTILRSVSPELDAEAIRIVNAMPLWKPGEQRGKPVNTKYTLPIQFRLPKQETPEGNIDEVTKEEADTVKKAYQVVEVMPEFPGGMVGLMKYLQAEVKYPEKAMKNNVQGRVIVQFVVDRDGQTTDFSILKSVSPELDAEALRVCKAMPKWSPGMQKGKPVRVKFTLPVQFRQEGFVGKRRR